MSADLVRWVIIVCAVLNLGAMVAIFERVGFAFKPRLWMRLLFAANVGWLTATLVLVHGRLGHPIVPGHLLLGLSAVAEFVALVGSWFWYGTPAGHEHFDRMTRDGDA